MSPYKSSSSLQNSVYSWSFTKTGKFNGMYKKLPSDSMYSIPDGKSTRYTSQGYGSRVDLKNKAGQNSPPPNTYKIKSCFEQSVEHRKGPIILQKYPQIVKFLLL